MNSAIKRITRDIKKIVKNDDNNGIYYFPNEDNLKEGYGLIIGTKDTPYHHGFYIIKFSFDDLYPFCAPKCKYITVSSVRQNPNLYEDGKVCISLIGTWGDNTWKPVFNIETILLSIQSAVLMKNALDREPEYDWSTLKPDMTADYEEIVRYCNYRYNIVKIYDELPLSIPHTIRLKIRAKMKDYLLSNEKEIRKQLDVLVNTQNNENYSCTFYGASVCAKYSKVQQKFQDLMRSFKRKKTKITITKKIKK